MTTELSLCQRIVLEKTGKNRVLKMVLVKMHFVYGNLISVARMFMNSAQTYGLLQYWFGIVLSSTIYCCCNTVLIRKSSNICSTNFVCFDGLGIEVVIEETVQYYITFVYHQ